MAADKRPGRIRRSARFVGRAAKFTVVGDTSEIKRTHAYFKDRIDRAMHPGRDARTETFEEACERLGLGPGDVARRAAQLGRVAKIYWGIAAIAFIVFCFMPFVDHPINHALMSVLVLLASLAKASVLRWRQAQCEYRTLMPYLVYWRAWWGRP